jgi:hypothetical protein
MLLHVCRPTQLQMSRNVSTDLRNVNFWLFGGSATLCATTGGTLNDLWPDLIAASDPPKALPDTTASYLTLPDWFDCWILH